MQKGVNDRVEKEQQWEWERVRWLACVNLQPHTKKGQNLTPQKLMKFEWEKKKVKTDIENRKSYNPLYEIPPCVCNHPVTWLDFSLYAP